MAGADHCRDKEDRISPDQTVLDEKIREGITALRTAPAQRDESASAGSHGADPQDHEGSACGRVPTSHQESLGIQTLGQTASRAEAVMHEDEEGSPALQLCANNVRSKTKTEFRARHPQLCPV